MSLSDRHRAARAPARARLPLYLRPPPPRRRRRSTAFTLVELLVVIGIIAALIGILLPVLSGVQARGRDLKCQSNIRQILMAFQGYAAENKGSMPYGIYFSPEDPGSFGPVGGSRFFSWASQVGKYVVKGADGDNLSNNFPPVLQCPEAELSYNHIVGYCANMVVFPSRLAERQALGSPNVISPAKLNQLFPHNALVWDTSVSPGLENNVGYLVGADVDDVQRFWSPDVPQQRYYDPADVFGRIPPGIYGNNKPIRFHATTWKNIDPGLDLPNGPGYPYQGNLRFRHGKDTACNVGFADGHVEAIKGRFNPDRTMKGGGSQNDATRKLFMMRWPSGIPRGPGP